MGTRNLTCFFIDGEYRIAQYGQWDGYPEGLGVDLLKELDGADLCVLADRVRAAGFITIAEYAERMESLGIDSESPFISMEESDAILLAYPELHRNTSGADLIHILLDRQECVRTHNQLEFAADSLFCEWCYVIDFDAQRFEVHKGFNQIALGDGERFKFLESEAGDSNDNEYQPVSFVAAFSLSDLPSEVDFLAVCSPQEEE